MISLNYNNNNTVSLHISKSESVNLITVKTLVRKARRIIEQNKASSLVITLDKTYKVDERALMFFNRILCCSNKFPVTIQHH